MDQVDLLVTSEDVGVAKPDPVIFYHTLQRCGITADAAIMVGDSWSNDIIGAHAAGLRAIWLNRRNECCPDPTIATEITDVARLMALLP